MSRPIFSLPPKDSPADTRRSAPSSPARKWSTRSPLAPARSCTASPTTRIPFRWPPDAPCCAICRRRNLVEAADSSRSRHSSRPLQASPRDLAHRRSRRRRPRHRPALGRGIRCRQIDQAPFPARSEFLGTRRRGRPETRPARLPHARQRRRHLAATIFFLRPQRSSRQDQIAWSVEHTGSVHPRSNVAPPSLRHRSGGCPAGVSPAALTWTRNQSPRMSKELLSARLISTNTSHVFNRLPPDLRLIPA